MIRQSYRLLRGRGTGTQQRHQWLPADRRTCCVPHLGCCGDWAPSRMSRKLTPKVRRRTATRCLQSWVANRRGGHLLLTAVHPDRELRRPEGSSPPACCGKLSVGLWTRDQALGLKTLTKTWPYTYRKLDQSDVSWPPTHSSTVHPDRICTYITDVSRTVGSWWLFCGVGQLYALCVHFLSTISCGILHFSKAMHLSLLI